MPKKPDSAMTVRDVAVYLNVDEKTIYRLASRGELPGFKVGGTWRFQLVDIQKWIDARKGLPIKKEASKSPETRLNKKPQPASPIKSKWPA